MHAKKHFFPWAIFILLSVFYQRIFVYIAMDKNEIEKQNVCILYDDDLLDEIAFLYLLYFFFLNRLFQRFSQRIYRMKCFYVCCPALADPRHLNDNYHQKNKHTMKLYSQMHEFYFFRDELTFIKCDQCGTVVFLKTRLYYLK